MKILVDADGTFLNWGSEWDFHALPLQHLKLPLTEVQSSFDLTLGLTDEGKAAVLKIMSHPGFYRNLQPFPGAVEALNDMLAEGHDVHIVTSPWIDNVTCASDKLANIEETLGKGWAKRTIITSDKTIVRGDILLDDKPDIDGSITPTWEHVYFTQPYNRDRTDKRRLDNWVDWRTLL